MTDTTDNINDLNNEELARFILDMFHRILVHHTLWFREVEHQMGFEKALGIMESARRDSYDVQVKRLSRVLGFEMQDRIPAPLLGL
ncbi:MAG TPA: cytosolic protein, partial [Deltaproteobacteria bacterium]|nr:cytosolic protein [Deltaproteobacteria bacterium]